MAPGDADSIEVSFSTKRKDIGTQVPSNSARTAKRSILALFVPNVASIAISLVDIDKASVEARM